MTVTTGNQNDQLLGTGFQRNKNSGQVWVKNVLKKIGFCYRIFDWRPIWSILEPRMNKQMPTVLMVSLKLPLVTNKLTQNDLIRVRFPPTRLGAPFLKYSHGFFVRPFVGILMLSAIQKAVPIRCTSHRSWDIRVWSLRTIRPKLGKSMGQNGTFCD